MGIRLRLLLGFLTMLVMGAAVALINLVLLSGTISDLRNVVSVTTVIERKGIEIQLDLSIISDAIRGYMLNTSDGAEKARISTTRQELLRDMDEIRRLAPSSEIAEFTRQAEELENKSMTALEDEILLTIDTTDLEVAKGIYFERYLPVQKQQEEMVRRIVNSSAQVRAAALEGAENSVRAAKVIAGLLLLLIIVIGFTLSIWLAGNLSSPIIKMAQVVKRAALGDLSGRMEFAVRADEIGALSRSLNTLNDYLRDMAAVAERIARGDLKARVEPRSQADIFGQAFHLMIENLCSSIVKIRDSSDQVAGASREIASACEQSAQLNGSASAAIEQTSAALHEMSANMHNVAKNTQSQAGLVSETSASIKQLVNSVQSLTESSREMVEVSQSSGEKVSAGVTATAKSYEAMTKINESIRSASETIKSLERQTEDIVKIVDVIASLADQTNLLSLNAAIEAARAGEHGLGFAVVASEVRRLADRSARSAEEIENIIKGIRRGSVRAVEDMDKSIQLADEGMLLCEEVGAALKKIEASVEKVYSFSMLVSAAAAEQSAGSSQIANATERLNELTKEISVAAEEQAAGVAEAVETFRQLRSMLGEQITISSQLASSGGRLYQQSEILQSVVQRFQFEREASVLPQSDLAVVI